MTELKPCPFCGMTVHWENFNGICHDNYNDCYSSCWPFCGEINVRAEDRAKIEAAWNNRAGEPKRCCANCKYPDSEGWCWVVDHQVDFRTQDCIFWVGEEE